MSRLQPYDIERFVRCDHVKDNDIAYMLSTYPQLYKQQLAAVLLGSTGYPTEAVVNSSGCALVDVRSVLCKLCKTQNSP